ncbi:MAG: DUF393 domain-containing protein [Phycisphaerae bacterium]|nr:DUF393 domain-containing protein [Phycisphaerae bacterium]
MPTPILFFDGECGLCARSVRWVLRRDRRRTFRFAPLQGETYRTLGIAASRDLSTMVVTDHHGVHVMSDAVLAIARHLGGGWRVLGAIGGIVPRRLRDAAYRAIASRRHRWFGTARACEIVAPDELVRFLS